LILQFGNGKSASVREFDSEWGPQMSRTSQVTHPGTFDHGCCFATPAKRRL
jgi:hypothetical protein